MEAIAALLMLAAIGSFLVGISRASGKWESEDRAQGEHFHPPTPKVNGKTPTSRTTDTSEAVPKSSEKAAASSQGPSQTM